MECRNQLSDEFVYRVHLGLSLNSEMSPHGTRWQHKKVLLTGCTIDVVTIAGLNGGEKVESRQRIASKCKDRVSIHHDQFRRPSHASGELLPPCPR